MSDENIRIDHLVHHEEFFKGFWAGTYSFAGNEWMYDTDDESGEAKGFQKMLKDFEDNHSAKLFFEVDPDDNTSDTLVLEVKHYVRHMGTMCQIIDEFFEEFTTGDKVHLRHSYGYVYVSIWFD